MTKQFLICSLLLAGVLPSLQASPKIIPFRIVRNLMVIRATVNGQTGNYIFDTGIPGMVLNARYFEGRPNYGGDCGGLQSIGGTSGDCRGDYVQMHLGELSVRGYAAVVDLSRMEQLKRMNILGMLGMQALKQFEIVLDYSTQEIQLYALDSKGNRRDLEDYLLPDETFQLKLLEHIPYITMEQNGQVWRLGLDTGAELNILAEAHLADLAATARDRQERKMLGMDGVVRNLHAARIPAVLLGAGDLPRMQTLFMPLHHLNQLSGPDLDGLLGQEFLQYFRTAINFKKRELYLWRKEAVIQAAMR